MSHRGYKELNQLSNKQLRIIDKSIEKAGDVKRQKSKPDFERSVCEVPSNQASTSYSSLPIEGASSYVENPFGLPVSSGFSQLDHFIDDTLLIKTSVELQLCNDNDRLVRSSDKSSTTDCDNLSCVDNLLMVNKPPTKTIDRADNSSGAVSESVSDNVDVPPAEIDELCRQTFNSVGEPCFDASKFINDDSCSYEDFVLVCDSCTRCAMCMCLLACGECKHFSEAGSCMHCLKCTEKCDAEYAAVDEVFFDDQFVSSEDSPLPDDLANWAVNRGITHASMKELLAIFNKHHPEDKLPIDPRTLLGTARNVTIRYAPPGSYWHNGLKKNLTTFFCDLEEQVIKLSFNVDGLPISASTNCSLWPILCNIVGTQEVFAVGIYHGYSKPDCESVYLQEFEEELTGLLNDGLDIGGRHFVVRVDCFICDDPAKCFVLCMKGYTGFWSCTKCTQKGKMVKKRVCFPETCTERTDESFFFQQEQGADFHHDTPSIISVPGVKPVSSFVLDPLHLLYLGVMKKLLLFWVFGERTLKMGRRVCSDISSLLKEIRRYRLIEFARMPLSLEFCTRFIGTEFRIILLYLGPVIFRLLKPQLYENFLVLHVAVRLLSSEEYCVEFNEYAGALIKNFVTNFKAIYGEEYVSHNIHGCVHIHKDVMNFGPLEKFSAFRFENFMQKLKKLVRKGEKPLQQVAKRYSEMEHVQLRRKKSKKLPADREFLYEHSEGPLLDGSSPPPVQSSER